MTGACAVAPGRCAETGDTDARSVISTARYTSRRGNSIPHTVTGCTRDPERPERVNDWTWDEARATQRSGFKLRGPAVGTVGDPQAGPQQTLPLC